MAQPASLLPAAALVAACAHQTAPTAARGPAAGRARPEPEPTTPLEGGATAADAVHLLARLSFGAKPGQAAELVKTGLSAWLDRQLKPAAIDDAAGTAALAPFADALKPFDELEDAAEQEAARMLDDGEADGAKKAKNKAKKELLLETQMTAIARYVASERQLLEVMTDFWTNHFAVSLQKGKVRFLASDFVEKTLRPKALGKFGDLLQATARHPAMLVYLDNARSVAPRPGSKPAKKGRGLNENYARELMELHTLGVDAGYTQDDVIAVARILSGWSVADGEYTFRARVHDDDAKTVMGTQFPAGGGEQEGVQLLEMLANHPKTIQHVCTQLCMQLVADDPPKEAIAAATGAWRATNGDIGAVVHAIASAPVFWRAAVRNAKIKSPLEVVVSAVRAVGGTCEGTGLAKLMTRLGQPTLLAPAPTGYADSAAAWLSTAGALERMDFALGLAAGTLPGVIVDLDRTLPLPSGEPTPQWRASTVATLDSMIAGGLTHTTRAVIETWIARPKQPQQARTIALALAFASPEFQRQ